MIAMGVATIIGTSQTFEWQDRVDNGQEFKVMASATHRLLLIQTDLVEALHRRKPSLGR